MFIATYIHNHILGACYAFEHYDEAIDKVVEIAESCLDRELTGEEFTSLVDDGEFYIDLDHDNQYTFTLAVTEWKQLLSKNG